MATRLWQLASDDTELQDTLLTARSDRGRLGRFDAHTLPASDGAFGRAVDLRLATMTPDGTLQLTETGWGLADALAEDFRGGELRNDALDRAVLVSRLATEGQETVTFHNPLPYLQTPRHGFGYTEEEVSKSFRRLIDSGRAEGSQAPRPQTLGKVTPKGRRDLSHTKAVDA